jgi:hypothetical protein
MAIYNPAYLGTTTNRIVFNDFTQTPIYRAISRQPKSRQLRDLDIPIPFESGISDFETLVGETIYLIDGVMYPGSEAEYDSGLAALRKVASLDVQQSDVLSDNGYVPYVWDEATQSKQIFMKVLYVHLFEDTRKGLVQPFRLVCKVKDPTIYSADLKVADTSEADFGIASGTAVYPFSYPIVYGASTSSVSVDANNIGDIPVYPVSINIHGPVNSPRITNTTSGEYIEVSVNLASSSNELVIAYDKDSLIVELDGVSVINNVTSSSTYFKIRPGSNVFSLTGSSISDDAYATVSFYSGWPLS